MSEEEERPLPQQLEVPAYHQDQFRGRRLKRSVAQFGYAYLATGRRLSRAEPLPGFLGAVFEKCLFQCPPGARFNQCIVTRYPRGAGIGWHVDARCFGECIVAISLGATAQLTFRQRTQGEVHYELSVAPRSFYLLSGPARWEYQHRITPVKAIRYSLTFRYVHEGGGGS